MSNHFTPTSHTRRPLRPSPRALNLTPSLSFCWTCSNLSCQLTYFEFDRHFFGKYLLTDMCNTLYTHSHGDQPSPCPGYHCGGRLGGLYTCINDILTAWSYSCEDRGRFLRELNWIPDYASLRRYLNCTQCYWMSGSTSNPTIPSWASSRLQFVQAYEQVLVCGRHVPHTFRSIAINETVRALWNSDTQHKFKNVQRRLLHRFTKWNYPPRVLRAIRDI